MITLKLLIILSSVVGSFQTNLQRADEQNEISVPGDVKPIEKRYSEATLASDYSKYMEIMRAKNLVDLLIGARWPTRGESSGMVRRDAHMDMPAQAPSLDHPLIPGPQPSRTFLTYLLKHQGNRSHAQFAEPAHSLLKPLVLQELLDRLQIAVRITKQWIQESQ